MTKKYLRKTLEKTIEMPDEKKSKIDWSKKGIRSRLDYCQYIRAIERNLKKKEKP
jgi:hypothetical protein